MADRRESYGRLGARSGAGEDRSDHPGRFDENSAVAEGAGASGCARRKG